MVDWASSFFFFFGVGMDLLLPYFWNSLVLIL